MRAKTYPSILPSNCHAVEGEGRGGEEGKREGDERVWRKKEGRGGEWWQGKGEYVRKGGEGGGWEEVVEGEGCGLYSQNNTFWRARLNFTFP